MERAVKRLSGRDFLKNGKHIRAARRSAMSFPWHSHEYFEIEVILSGNGVMQINDKRYELSAGSVYLLTPADFHDMTCFDSIEQWNISFDEIVPDPAWRDKLFRLSVPFRQVDTAKLARLDTVAQLIAEESDSPLRVEPLLEYLLKTADLWEAQDEPISPIRRAILFVETYFREDPSLADAAAHACLSPTYFGTLFRETTGETYISYLNRCKVNCAMMLLKNGHTVTEACFSSGFGSLSGFRYIFKQKTGETPTEYIQKQNEHL